MTQQIRALLVDDHALFREGLASLLAPRPDIEVIGEAEDGLEALVKARELHPDLILMDVSMPGCDGLEATHLIKEALPDVKIVMLTIHDDDERLFGAIRAGASGYVLKSTASEQLIPMLQGAMRGEAALSGKLAARILEAFAHVTQDEGSGQEEALPVLTFREKQVLTLAEGGATDKDIAAELSISVSTAKTHMRNILAKLHASSRHEAAAYATRQGLIHPLDCPAIQTEERI